MARYKAKSVPLEVLKQLPGTEIESSISPPSNIRRKTSHQTFYPTKTASFFDLSSMSIALFLIFTDISFVAISKRIE